MASALAPEGLVSRLDAVDARHVVSLRKSLRNLRDWALRHVARHVTNLTRQQWASLAVLLLILWRCRRDLQREIRFWLTHFQVKKDFLKEVVDADKFSDFQKVLPGWLLEGLREYPEMKPIQRKVLPLALAGKDVVAVAPTGSGKTLAFLVPAMVHAAQSRPRFVEGPVALILAPTRELVLQILGVAQRLCDHRFTVGAVYGGAQRQGQLDGLRRKGSLQLLVAVIGRLLDFFEKGDFRLSRCSFLVLDEGDKMLEDGFEQEVQLIGREVRRDRQVLFFSATWPSFVERAAQQLCRSQLCRVALEEEEDEGRMLPPSVIQQVVEVVHGQGHQNKLPILLQHLEECQLSVPLRSGGGKALIFVRSRQACEELAQLVAEKFCTTDALHGQRRQEQRETSLRNFRSGRTRALVTTDVLGRGVDVPDVSLVFIYDFPDDIETYIHRVGRTGRNGRHGKAVSLFFPQYWNGYMAKELQDVLEACEQEVPEDLEKATSSAFEGGWQDWRGKQWRSN